MTPDTGAKALAIVGIVAVVAGLVALETYLFSLGINFVFNIDLGFWRTLVLQLMIGFVGGSFKFTKKNG